MTTLPCRQPAAAKLGSACLQSRRIPCLPKQYRPCLRGEARRECLTRCCTAQEKVAVVREAGLADLDTLAAIEDRSRPGGNWSRSSLESELKRDTATVLLAELGRQAVGLAVAWLVPPDELHVMELAVLPEHRRQGLGRRLMQSLVEMHRGRVGLVLLEVRVSNHGAQRLYEQLGFEAVGTRRRYYQNGEDALLMNLYLPWDDDDQEDQRDSEAV